MEKILSSFLIFMMRIMVGESNFLSERQIEDLQMLAEITNAMAASDGFQNLDACLEKNPKRLNIYNRYATAALRAMRRVQGYVAEIMTDELPTGAGVTIATVTKGGRADT